jgi:hypothetical protein
MLREYRDAETQERINLRKRTRLRTRYLGRKLRKHRAFCFLPRVRRTWKKAARDMGHMEPRMRVYDSSTITFRWSYGFKKYQRDLLILDCFNVMKVNMLYPYMRKMLDYSTRSREAALHEVGCVP